VAVVWRTDWLTLRPRHGVCVEVRARVTTLSFVSYNSSGRVLQR